jgi:hypothetical protein
VFSEADYRNRIASIRDEWSSLRGHRERKHMARKHALLQEVVRLSRPAVRRDLTSCTRREDLERERHD